jgi:hypothetical protein
MLRGWPVIVVRERSRCYISVRCIGVMYQAKTRCRRNVVTPAKASRYDLLRQDEGFDIALI